MHGIRAYECSRAIETAAIWKILAHAFWFIKFFLKGKV